MLNCISASFPQRNSSVTSPCAIVISVGVADEALTGFNPQIVQQLDQMMAEYLARLDRADIVGRTRTATNCSRGLDRPDTFHGPPR